MNCKIDYSQEDGFIHVKMLAPADLEGGKQIYREASSVAREHHSHKYLIDHRGVDLGASIPDIDRVPDEFKEIGMDFEGKIAILLDSSTPKIDLFRFLKNVFAKSWIHLELFVDEDEAVAWLRSA